MMKRYERPLVLANEELAEGVYAASGSIAVSQASYTLSCTSTGGEWYPHAGYYVTVTNSGTESIANWSVTLNVTSANATGVSSWEPNRMWAELSGNQILLAGIEALGAGESLTVGFTLDYEGAGVTVE